MRVDDQDMPDCPNCGEIVKEKFEHYQYMWLCSPNSARIVELATEEMTPDENA